MSWTEAVAYCAWLARETGRPCRLPTEAEWERAARGGAEDARYAWGDERPPADGALPAPPVVGSGPVNGFGLTNLAGAVHEWCLDWYVDDAYARGPDRNPSAPPPARGGSPVAARGATRIRGARSRTVRASPLTWRTRTMACAWRAACAGRSGLIGGLD